MGFNKREICIIEQETSKVKNLLTRTYGNTPDSLMGKCIEASDFLVKRLLTFSELNTKNIKIEAKQVWCLYECFESCSNYPYEEHWLVKITKGNQTLYIDLTMKQFQWAFTKELPDIYIRNTLPNFYLTRKPGKITLDKCGWNDWYNYGNYVNNFNYWGGIQK